MTIQKIFDQSIQKLKSHQIPSAQLDAEVLLSFAINKSKEHLYSHPEEKINFKQWFKFKKLISKRIKKWPVAYLIGYKEFYNLKFKVDPHVLIPRPETELLVDQTLQIYKQLIISNQQLAISDIGTGSGCIIISIAKNLPSNLMSKLYATDISKSALKIAQLNAKNNQVSNKIDFYQGNLLEPLKNKKIDLLIANLPYLTQEEFKNVPREPQSALISQNQGLQHYQQLFSQIKQLNYQPQYILIEIGFNQAVNLKNIILHHLPQAKIKVFQDLSGKDRILQIS
jgi:release factor glutamine methyltransferase